MRQDGVIINHGLHLILGQFFNLLNFVGGAEAIEEMDKRHTRLERRSVRNERHIHCFLHAVGGQQRKTGRAGSRHIRVVTKNRKCLRGQRAGSHMEDRGSQFTRDLVHIRDHQEETL